MNTMDDFCRRQILRDCAALNPLFVILYAKVLTSRQQGSQMDLSINPVSFPTGFYFPIIGPEPEVPRLPGAHIIFGCFGVDIRPLTEDKGLAEDGCNLCHGQHASDYLDY